MRDALCSVTVVVVAFSRNSLDVETHVKMTFLNAMVTIPSSSSLLLRFGDWGGCRQNDTSEGRV